MERTGDFVQRVARTASRDYVFKQSWSNSRWDSVGFVAFVFYWHRVCLFVCLLKWEKINLRILDTPCEHDNVAGVPLRRVYLEAERLSVSQEGTSVV